MKPNEIMGRLTPLDADGSQLWWDAVTMQATDVQDGVYTFTAESFGIRQFPEYWLLEYWTLNPHYREGCAQGPWLSMTQSNHPDWYTPGTYLGTTHSPE